MVVILGLSLVSTALGLLQPYLTKFLIDDGLIAQRLDVIIWICLFMVTIGLGATGLGALNRWYYVDVSARMLFALREAVFGHLQRLSPSFHARARGGDLLARLDGDIAEIQRFAVDSLLALINGLIALLGALALMVTLSWRLSLLALILLPVNVFFLRHIRPRIEHLTRTARERASDITAFFFERLSAVKFIQSVAAEDREEQQLATLHQTLPPRLAAAANDELYGQRRAHGPDLGKHGNRLYSGGYYTVAGALSVGTLIAFSVYLARATGPVQTLLGLYVAMRRARVSLRRVMELTETDPASHHRVRRRRCPRARRVQSVWTT